MQQLYQWCRRWTSLFRSKKSDPGASRTVCKETTVHRQRTTVLVSGSSMSSAATAFDSCPLCGQKLSPQEAEQAKPRLSGGPDAA